MEWRYYIYSRVYVSSKLPMSKATNTYFGRKNGTVFQTELTLNRSKQASNQRVFASTQQLDHSIVQGVLVLLQPTSNNIRYLY